MIRRVKSEVEGSLLPKIEFVLKPPLTPLQRDWYRTLLGRKGSGSGDGSAEGGGGVDGSATGDDATSLLSTRQLLHKMLQLQKASARTATHQRPHPPRPSAAPPPPSFALAYHPLPPLASSSPRLPAPPLASPRAAPSGLQPSKVHRPWHRSRPRRRRRKAQVRCWLRVHQTPANGLGSPPARGAAKGSDLAGAQGRVSHLG